MRRFGFYILTLTLLFIAGCTPTEFPEETQTEKIFTMQGSFNGEAISMNPGDDNLYLFTWMEELTPGVWQLNGEVRDADCEDCGETLRLGLITEADSETDLLNAVAEGDHSFFSPEFSETTTLTLELDSDFSVFTEFQINGETVSVGEGTFDVESELFEEGFEMTLFLFEDECYTTLEYGDVTVPPCDSYINLPLIYWEFIEEDLVAVYPPEDYPSDAFILWSENFGEFELLGGDEPFIVEVNDFTETLVNAVFPVEEYHSHSVYASISSESDCEPIEFELYRDNFILSEGVEIEYNTLDHHFITHTGCESDFEDYEQPEWATFTITNVESFDDNENGQATVKYDFSIECELIDPDDETGDAQVLQLSGTSAFPIEFD